MKLCQQLLNETAVGMAGPRTALGDAIGLAIRTFETSQVDQRLLVLLFWANSGWMFRAQSTDMTFGFLRAASGANGLGAQVPSDREE